MRILFVCKENKNNDFIQQFASSASPYRAILDHIHSITYVNNVCNMYADTLIMLFTLWSEHNVSVYIGSYHDQGTETYRTLLKWSMWYQWINYNFMKLWEYFLCVKKRKENKTKQKKMTLFNNSSPWHHFGEYHDTCVCFPLNVNKVQRMRVLRQQHHAHALFMCRKKQVYASWYSPKWL